MTTQSANELCAAWVKKRRGILGLSQIELSQMIDVTYQQIHKYESGLNRMSIGRWVTICEAMYICPDLALQEALQYSQRQVRSQSRASLKLAKTLNAMNEDSRACLDRIAKEIMRLQESKENPDV